jgi:hypothetical protein
MSVAGKYKITMVLPAWTVENELELIPEANGILTGTLNTMNGDPETSMVSFNTGFWNKDFFQVTLSVGPGNLELVGKIENNAISGVVIIESTPDALTGIRV